MAKSKLVKTNEKIAREVVGGYKKIEEGVVGVNSSKREGVKISVSMGKNLL